MRSNRLIGTLIGLVFGVSTAHASTISYDITNLAGNTWEYSYTVENDTLGVDIEEFTVFFEFGLYENLAFATAPLGWDPIAIQPDSSLPDDGFYDAFAFVSGIASGDSLGGFSVQFDFLGSGTPGSQPFDIVDPLSFESLDSGLTQLQGAVPVPEPSSLGLFALGLLGLIVVTIRKGGRGWPEEAMNSLPRIAAIVIVAVGTLPLSAELATAQDLAIADRTLISKQRVGRTLYEYTYVAEITNAGVDVQNVTATVTSRTSQTTVVDAELSFGDVTSGATVASSDTFTIRQDRRYPFSWDNLRWDFTFQTGTLSIILDQASRVAGVIAPEGGSLSTIGADGRSYTLDLPPDALQSAQEISLTPVTQIEGLPIGQNILAVAHVAPSGLLLKKAASLTIEPFPPLSAGKVPLGFVVEDDGQSYRIIDLDIAADRASLQIPHFSIAGTVESELKKLADYVLGKYDAFHDQLVNAESCTDPLMAQAAQLVAEFQAELPLVGDTFAVAARDCVYRNQMSQAEKAYSQCSTYSDFAEAAKISLKNKIEEIFTTSDEACRSDSNSEMKALECIGFGNYLSQSDLLSDYDDSGLKSFGDILFEKKTCGIHTLEVIRDSQHMSIGDSKPLWAVAKDKAGNILGDRVMIWENENPDVVAMVVDSPNTVQVTARNEGDSFITAKDKSSTEAVVELLLPGQESAVTIPATVGQANIALSRIVVSPAGGAAELQLDPPKLELIPPEFATLEATLWDVLGNIMTPTSYDWRSSDKRVVVVDAVDNSRARITPLSAGVATITATETGTGLRGTANVVVGAKMIVTPARVCLPVGEAAQLSATVGGLEGKPLIDPDPFDIVWFTPDNSTVSVSIDGVAVAHSPGEVQIQASYNNLVGFTSVLVPEFLDYRDLTPVYTPPSFNWDGVTYASKYRLNDLRQVESITREALTTVAQCEIDEALPLQIVKSNTGLFAYPYSDYYAYIYDSNTCEEFEIPIDAQLFPNPVAINDNAQVAGNTVDSFGTRRGFIYDPESDSVQTVSEGCGTGLVDINNNGEVIGEAGPCFRDPKDELPPEPPEKAKNGFNFIYSNGVTIRLPNDIPGVPMEEEDGVCVGSGESEVCNNDPTAGFEWIRPSAINDEGVVVGSYRYWDEGFGWFRVKGFIYYQDQYRLIDPPPFPSTLPVQGEWRFLDINNHDDILIFSLPLAGEDLQEDFTLSAMHLCPL